MFELLPFCIQSNFFFFFRSLIVTYNTLPETEGRTLEDIEVHFSDNQKKFTDRNIMKNVAKEIDISDDENQTTHC